MKNQFKKADKSGAAIGLIIGEDEAANGQVTVKLLRKHDVEAFSGQKIIVNVIRN